MDAGERSSGERLNREQLVQAVDVLIRGGSSSEPEADELLTRIMQSVPHGPTIAALIYYPPRPLTAAEIVDEALAYKPIAL